MDFIGPVFFLAILLIFILKSDRFSLNAFPKYWIYIALAFKIVAAIAYFVVYTYYYTERSENDMYRYYDDAKVMYSAFDEDKFAYFQMVFNTNPKSEFLADNYYNKMNNWYRSLDDIVGNDNRTIIRICAFFMLFAFDSFFTVKLLFVFMAFLGLFLIYKTLENDDFVKNKLLFIFVFFMPSLVFWTSSISKEALLVFALGGFVFYFKKLFLDFKFSFLSIILFLVFGFVLSSVKMYVILALLPALIALVLSKFIRFNRFALFLFTFVCLISIYWNFHYVFPDYNFVQTFVSKQHDFINFSIFVNAGSFFEMKMLEPSLFSFISALPNAFYSVFFRPFFFDASNFLMLAASFENFIFLIFLIFSLLFYQRNFKPDSWFWAKIFFVFFFFSIIGISTPVSGAVVRYKIIVYPFLVSAVLSFVNTKNLVNFTNSFFKNL